jgi:hypothetical protein
MFCNFLLPQYDRKQITGGQGCGGGGQATNRHTFYIMIVVVEYTILYLCENSLDCIAITLCQKLN